MKKNLMDPNEPVGKLSRVTDFLPPPEKLVTPEENVKVTISLSKASVRFFKAEASKHHTKYQKMIRTLVDTYTAHYQHH
ncbi:MAG: CopG family transcriptional regulator [Elusimicrobia bacterium]|nr:CopG family transcriptional regulator [Elusimicrobiota bacterium]